MDRSFIARNNASRDRLQAVVTSLSDDRLGLVIGGEWTVAATLAHLAFADFQIYGWLEEWERQGIHTSTALQEWNQAATIRLRGQNEEMLPHWLVSDPHSTRREVVTAAERIDAKIENLSAELTAVILETSLFGRRRPWVLDRSIHRHEHLDAIDRAVASGDAR